MEKSNLDNIFDTASYEFAVCVDISETEFNYDELENAVNKIDGQIVALCSNDGDEFRITLSEGRAQDLQAELSWGLYSEEGENEYSYVTMTVVKQYEKATAGIFCEVEGGGDLDLTEDEMKTLEKYFNDLVFKASDLML